MREEKRKNEKYKDENERKKEEGRRERDIRRKRGVGEDIVDAWCMIGLTRQWWTQPPVRKAVVDPTTCKKGSGGPNHL
jgi:hypothetical protein